MKRKLRIFSAIAVCAVYFLAMSIVKAEAGSRYQIGDVDLDGKIGAADALLVLQNEVGLQEMSDYQQAVADVNKDGNIDASDALQILKVTVKLQPFTVRATLRVGDTYTIDKVYDAGTYKWSYTLAPTEGLSVERAYQPLPENAAPGDMSEQVYTITAKQPGTYELNLRLTPVGDPQGEAIEEINYIFEVE